MAAHGEIQWPPVGRFNGRLWGELHGHRHTPISEGGREISTTRSLPQTALGQVLRIVPKRSSKTSRSSTATACAKRLAVTVQRSRKPTLPSRTKL